MPGGFMSGSRRSTEIEGHEPGPGEDMELDANFVGPRYFTVRRFRFWGPIVTLRRE
jgi:hypothetical protein